jgi:ketosteroid isomerase-like protein
MSAVRPLVAATFASVLVACEPAECPQAPAPPLATALSLTERCTVWDRENSFARSVAEHDARAFAEHVHPHAVFAETKSTMRGRDEVVAGWAGIVKGEGIALEWHPTSVDVIDDHTALTRGPFWITTNEPGEPPKYLVGTFQSTWVRDVDGVWRVAVDGGAEPKAATQEEVNALASSLSLKCPG